MKGFRKNGVERHLDRPSPAWTQTLLHPENSSETFGVRLILWFKIASDNRIFKIKHGDLTRQGALSAIFWRF